MVCNCLGLNFDVRGRFAPHMENETIDNFQGSTFDS